MPGLSVPAFVSVYLVRLVIFFFAPLGGPIRSRMSCGGCVLLAQLTENKSFLNLRS